MIRLLLAFSILVFSAQVSATDIILKWNPPEVLEDGSEITSIDRFTIYHTANNGSESTIQVDSSDNSFQISDIKTGNHSFQITTSSNGIESERSNTALYHEPFVLPSKPVKILLTVEIIE